jgi:phenylacetate-coenzyme A ligase PaaK-like adenylate-forming protein
MIACGQLPGPPFLRAIMPFTGVLQGALGDQERDLFWDVFQVPLFEQFLSPDGHVAGAECEAHESLHVIPRNVILETEGDDVLFTSLTGLEHPAIRLETGFQAALTRRLCACGRPGARLVDLQSATARQPTSACAAD